MITAGVDAGSRATKVVVFDYARRVVLAREIADQGVHQDQICEALLESAARRAGLAKTDIDFIVATGYARENVPSRNLAVTEITCHARGVREVAPGARTVVEIGGQDSKLLRLDPDGGVRDFAMNDRCAAGTGRFLEMVAARLDAPVAELGEIAKTSARPAAISSMCVVFAETEIIGLLAAGAAQSDIVAGVEKAVATRVASMAAGKIDPPVVFTGGVALIKGMDAALAATLGHEILVVADPQFTGALGAAVVAGERLAKGANGSQRATQT